MISESLAKNPRHLIPINSNFIKFENRKDIVNLSFENIYNKESQTITLGNINEENLGIFIYTVQLIITTLSFLESENSTKFNPFTQPNVELAKNEYGKHNIILPSLNKFQIPISKITKDLKYISFLIFTENQDIKQKYNKYNELISLEEKIIKKIMNKNQIPYFIDFAPAYLHTTGELHKKKIENVYHILVYTTKEDTEWKVNSDSNGLRDIINIQLQSEIEIFKKHQLNFDIIHLAKLNEYLTNLF